MPWARSGSPNDLDDGLPAQRPVSERMAMTNRVYLLAAVLGLAAVCSGAASAQEPVEMSISDLAPVERIPEPPVADAEFAPLLERQDADLRSGWPWMSPTGAHGVPYHSAATLPRPPHSVASCTDSCPLCRPSGPLRRRWREQWKPLMQETHWGYCEYFEPVPYGSMVHEAIVRQLAKAYRERLVLYQVDFRAVDDPHREQLTERGRRELARILQDMQIVPGLILIEHSRTDPDLDRQRRAYVQNLLETLGSGVPPEAVIVGPAPGGLSGLEALTVFGKFLGSTGAAGGSMPATSGRPGAGAAAGVGAGLGVGGGVR
jgi:hypothetical protein